MLYFKRNYVIIGLCLFYLLSGLIFIEVNPIAGDEPFSIYFSGQPYSKIWSELFTGNNPPLYETMLKTIHFVFGPSVLVFRLPSLLFAVATLYLFFQFLQKYFSKQAAVLFGLMYCFSDYFITFSLEARGYSMLNFLICLAVIFFFKAFREKSKAAGVCLIFVNCLLLLTHYLSALFILVQVLTLLFSEEVKQKMKNLLLYYGTTALVMSPLILTVLLKIINNQKELSAWPGPPEGINAIYNMIWRFSNKPLIAVIVISLLVVIPFIMYKRKGRIILAFQHLFFLFWFPFLFLAMFTLSFKVPMFVDRYLMLLALGFYGTIAVIISQLFNKKNYTWIVGLSLALLFGITHRWVIDNKRPLNKIADWINTNREHNETQTVLSDYQMLHGMAYHINREAFFKSTHQRADQHLLNILSAKNIGFDFDSAPELLVIEQGKPVNTNIQSKISQHGYRLIKEDYLPEFYKLKKYSKE